MEPQRLIELIESEFLTWSGKELAHEILLTVKRPNRDAVPRETRDFPLGNDTLPANERLDRRDARRYAFRANSRG